MAEDSKKDDEAQEPRKGSPKRPTYMDEAEDLIERFEKACKRKHPWEDHMEQCYRYALPHREHFDNETQGARKHSEIFDSTAVDAVQRFKSRLQATLMPPWRKWTKLTPGANVPREKRNDKELQEGMDRATDTVFDFLNHSNLDIEINEAFGDLSVSTGAIMADYEVRQGKLKLIFNAAPLGELVLEEGPNGLIETVWRKRKIRLRNVERTWPGAKVKPDGTLAKRVQKSPDDEEPFIEGVIYDPELDWYFGVAIHEDTKEIVWSYDYEVSPWIVFRWSVKPGEIYGRGPVMSALPDILTANKVVEFVLRNAALSVAGVYTSTDREVLNPFTATINPAMIIPVRSNDSQNPTLRPLERSGDFNVAELVLDDLRNNIKRVLFNNMRTAEGPVKSATEIALDHIELVQDSGASFGRLQTELVMRLIRRVVHILAKEGKIPQMQVDGQDVDLEHQSPLARAQEQEDILLVQQVLETTLPLGLEMVAMSLKVEEVPGYVAGKAGFPAELQRDEAEKEALKEKVQQHLTQMMAAQQAQAGGSNGQ